MKAVLKGNTGGDKTSYQISQINLHFNAEHPNHELFNQAKKACINLNDKNIGEIIGRLYKDWSNFFTANYKFDKANGKYNNKSLDKPSYPKPKKLSKVFNYSVPLEVSKFSLSKEHKGLLGINLAQKMAYVKYYSFDKSNNKPEYLNKTINSINVSLSHGHIYYNLQYIDKLKTLNNNELVSDNCFSKNKINNLIEHKIKPSKIAGLDIGVINTASIFINDEKTQSIIVSGKELISYNCNFNKRLSKLAVDLSNQVILYKTIVNRHGNEQNLPARYSKQGKKLIYRRSQLFERRKLFMHDYMHKLSKKISQYLEYNEVTKLVISKNLSFAKTEGSIKMGKKSKQKFYQIPFGLLLNLLESKLQDIDVLEVNEAYTSKTSSLTADVVKVQNMKKELILPNDFNGSRGSKKKGILNNHLGRGLFKDMVINKIINADLNAAVNHIKIGVKDIKINTNLWKYCNPKKIKSNHEFDKLLKSYQIVDIQRA